MSTRICTGKGDCLTQTDDPNTYGKNTDVSCSYNCEPMKCPNYLVCGDIGPKWYFNCHWGTCWNCKIMFGKQKMLEFSEDECPVCMETKTCVTLLNCAHKECVDCFKRAWYGADTPQPPFPLPEERYEEYEEGLLDNHPLIVEWNRKLDKWENDKIAEHQREQNLRCCPLCRK